MQREQQMCTIVLLIVKIVVFENDISYYPQYLITILKKKMTATSEQT